MIAKIGQSAARFLRDEDGAVTVDWVVLTAAVVGLGLVIGPTIGQNTVNLAGDIGEQVASVEIHSYGYGGTGGASDEGTEGDGGSTGGGEEGGEEGGTGG